MSNYIPLDRPSDELLLQLINDKNQIVPELTKENVSLDPPIALSQSQVSFYQRNTQVLVRAIDNSGYSGTRFVYYNRIDILELFGTSQVPVSDGFSSPEEALSLLNQSYGLSLSASDFSSITLNPSGNAVFVTGNSYVYLPGKELIVTGLGDLLELEAQADRLWYYVNYTLPNEVGTVD